MGIISVRIRSSLTSSVSGGLLVLACSLFCAPAAFAEEEACASCHVDLAAGPVKHAALDAGCKACHAALDASSVPHRSMGAVVRGLSELQPELCFGCHERAMLARKNVHAAALIGCTSCHDPHSSKNRTLLKSAPPDLCFSCHDRSIIRGKCFHGPSDAGLCLVCHTPHASNERIALLVKKPVDLCLFCHESLRGEPHLIGGITYSGHPVGLPRTPGGKRLRDPLRRGKPFYCGSCHNPHSSNSRYLIRFAAASPQETCIYCHKK